MWSWHDGKLALRLSRSESKACVAELVHSGELIPVSVEGWKTPAYLWPGSQCPKSIKTRALLSLFDSLIWTRERTERLFGFRYCIEIYTPAVKRVHGYYVLPFLLNESLVARLDLKSDRGGKTLRVQGAFIEDGADPGLVAAELAQELNATGRWLELERVEVAKNGSLQHS